MAEQKRTRLICMLGLTFGFFVVEVVVSRVTASLAMLSDSFHMLSDVLALLVALVAVRFADQTSASSQNTFGWIRAEVLGALVNAVFLTALCFSILLEAVERYTDPREIENPRVVVWVGLGGLAVNVLGLLLFRGYAGHGHGHSHGTNHRTCEKPETLPSKEEVCHLLVKSNRDQGSHIVSRQNLNVPLNANISLEELENSSNSASQLNMRGVFLHLLGDALGSVIVVVNALIFTYVWRPCDGEKVCINPCYSSHCSDHQPINPALVGLSKQPSNSTGVYVTGPCWVLYLDPTLCLIMVAILLYTSFPLLKESILILLQSVPKHIDMERLDKKLRSLEGVLAVHELHIWQLSGSRIIATVHIKCHNPVFYMDIAKRIKSFFHDEGIHATTIQPEFLSDGKGQSVLECELSCNKKCNLKLCCDSSWKSGYKSDTLVQTEDPCCQNTLQRQTASWNLKQELKIVRRTDMESSV
ncbi:proton-coupled zinc antiporter SLC30A1 [Trichomycterus rosablanca]|uniref:proton-coupled zinc antiporter SLC30A1 n=1 Tax=Trichomycterus rosablanca TaxID=2290929 RepID=UPI002F352029